MTQLVALFLTVVISLSASTILAMVAAQSLRTSVAATGDERGTAAFWIPYAVVMLYLIPLFVGILIGVGTIPTQGVDPAAALTRILASVLGGCLLAFGGLGSRFSKNNYQMTLRRSGASRSHDYFED